MNTSGTFQYDVAMALFNGSQYLEEMIQSILKQAIKPQKIVLVDDKSTDNTLEIAKKLKDLSPVKIEIVENPQNLGLIKTFEIALNLTTSPWTAIADQDDYWEPNKIQILSQSARNVEPDIPTIVYSDLAIADANLAITNSSFMQAMGFDKKTKNSLVYQNYIPGCSMLVNRALLNKMKPFPQVCQMHDWWLLLGAQFLGKVIYHPQALVRYRQHNHNVVGHQGLWSIFKKMLRQGFSFGRYKNYERQVMVFLRYCPELRSSPLFAYLSKPNVGLFERILATQKYSLAPAGFLKKIVFWVYVLSPWSQKRPLS